MLTILIADDQPDVLEALRFLLKGEGYRIETAGSPSAVLALLDSKDFDAAILDLNYARDTTSGKEGLDLLAEVRRRDENLPVIVMTAWGSVDLAVEAMRQGARDFVQKPWDNARLLATVRTQLELGSSLRKVDRLQAENEMLRAETLHDVVAESPAMQPVLRMIARVGPSDANVLVTGEHGSGKGVVARAIHRVSSRAARPLVTVNTGGLSEGVFESELFGHTKGAYTDAKSDRVGRFELADGGTLFLDEIANVPLGQQAKLLRVLETGEFERVGSSKTHQVNVRILSATNANLREEVETGRFREDLLYRLNTIEIVIPPLRDRREDIPLLAAQFLSRNAEKYRKEIRGFSRCSMQVLMRHNWPGNVRELEHTMERAVLMSTGHEIREEDLFLQVRQGDGPRLDDLSLEEMEKLLIEKALSRFDGNVSKTADALGLSRSALYRRLQRYNL
ncbi:MAG: sigma-54-dependent Fis family transcriptional regulator [Bryobacterales bacterium]|nr:sigma-54-dependent Fis family transcriptional regulator [Bryobacterales bacterium]